MYITLEGIIINEGFLHPIWVCYVECREFLLFFLSIKQKLGYAWLLVPHTLAKLILLGINLSVKQNLGHA